MDPVTHSLVGAALSRAGLHRATPLATATLVIAANAPDLDIVAYAGGEYAALGFRRGVTHGPLALLLLPLVVTAAMLVYDRIRLRRAPPDAAPARAGPLLALAMLGVATHAPLDWLNTYGVRLFAPLDMRWYYGDALFIIDPWIWLVLAAAVVAHTRSRRAWTGWFALGFLATGLIFITPQVPLLAKVVWSVGVTLAAFRAVQVQRHGSPKPNDRLARLALATVALYIAAMVGADLAARNAARRAARERGYDIQDLMVAPAPANPFAGDIVVRTPTAYQLGTFRWLASPRIRWQDSIPEGPRTATVLETLRLPEVRDFLRWSRYPYVEVTADEESGIVRWGDARYPEQMRGGLSGVMVRVDASRREPAPDR